MAEHLILAENLTGSRPLGRVHRVVFVDDNGDGHETEYQAESKTWRVKHRVHNRAIIAVAVYTGEGMHFAMVTPVFPEDPGLRSLNMPDADALMLTYRVPVRPPIEGF